MSEDQKSREEFEAYWRGRQLETHRYVDRECPADWAGAYKPDAWKAWQASRRTYRASVLEEAAKACEDMHDEDRPSDYAYAMRALAMKTQEGQEPC